MKRTLFSLAVCTFTASSIFSQSSVQLPAGEIMLAMQKLNTVGSVLYIAAHPDDENTRLLSYLSSERKLRTGYLSLTRGDGGQNLVGKEQAELLGLIRTQELLAARRIDGAEQFFTRANDFGFSKNPEETFGIWNKDSILADVVWTIRQFKPEVIICRFPTTGEGGHGHHTASAILAEEAFDAAADPKRFPQQLKYVQVWKTKRLFWNTFNFGTNNTTSNDQLKIDVGIYNPLLGKGYGEIAAESRSMHKSQGFGSAKTRGSSLEYFKQIKGDVVKQDLFEGLINDWYSINPIYKKSNIQEAIDHFDLLHPEKSLPYLVAVYKELQSAAVKHPHKEQKLRDLEKLILSCAGLWLEANATTYAGIPGKEVSISAQAVSRNNYPVKIHKLYFPEGTDTSVTYELKQNELKVFKHRSVLPAGMPFSNPYWLREKHGAGLFTVNDPLLIGKPENDAPVRVAFGIEIEGQVLKIERDVVYKFTDPVKGEVYRPFEVLPPATVNLPEKVFVFADANPRMVSFTVKSNGTNVSGTLEAEVPAGWTLELDNKNFNLAKAGDETMITARLSPGKNPAEGKLKVHLLIDGKTYHKSIQRIEYDHIPYQFILTDAEAGLTRINLNKAGTRIGYIAGAGDDVPASLKQIGYDVTMLTDEQLMTGNLGVYNAIVTGVRAYNTNDRMPAYYNRLMEYVQKGGNLVVQYNTNSRVGPLGTKIGPYAFTISRDRVTNEKAEIRFIEKGSPILTYPNVIGTNDFENWIQERGIYFATERDSAYQAVFSMNDPGEKELDGSLIYASYGKGRFIYTGLAFFRELPAGVPGAYRLFVNLLSLPPRNQ